jgi:hypothetical protein
VLHSCLWSADRALFSQTVKRRMAAFPHVRHAAVRTAHSMRLGGILGLNAVRGLYFRPEGGRIVEAKGYRTPNDGEPHEVLACILRVMQLLRFDGEAFLQGLSEDSPPKVSALIDAMVAGKDVLEATVWRQLLVPAH